LNLSLSYSNQLIILTVRVYSIYIYQFSNNIKRSGLYKHIIHNSLRAIWSPSGGQAENITLPS